jgi:outer membrane protein assembly factor BamD
MIKKTNYLILIILSFVLLSCASKKDKEVEIVKSDLETQMVEAYNAGLKALNEGDALFAAKNFKTVENIYPQSIWASRSILMAAYSYYSQDYYGDAISELKNYIKKYPASENLSYAYYLLAICYYELIVDEKKDLSALIESEKYFKLLIEEYPNTDFALDGKFKIELIRNILAAKEVYIGKYYQTKKKWIPAINRLKNVLQNYSQTEYVQEALHRLVEINYTIGLDEEANKYAALLGYNYQSSIWYEESYKIFNREYESQVDKIKKDKENILLKKFKDLFN